MYIITKVMDFNQIGQRMKLAQRIRDTWRESRDVRDLVAILQDHTFGMTRDELEKFLMETVAPSLEQAWSERDASEQKLAEKERELEEERKAKKQAQEAMQKERRKTRL